MAASDDLDHWEVGPPLASSMLTHCPECPEVFQLGDWWYLVESRYSERMQTVYRVARTPEGPWESRRLDSLDGRRFYAAKSASDGERRMSFAWIPFRKHHDPKQHWVWGGELGSPRELLSQPDGTLTSRLPPEVAASYADPVAFELDTGLGDWGENGAIACDATGAFGHAFLRGPGRDDVLLDVVVEPGAATEAAGVLIEPRGGGDLDSGYVLAIEPMKGRILLDQYEHPFVTRHAEAIRAFDGPVILDGGGWKDWSPEYLRLADIPIVSEAFFAGGPDAFAGECAALGIERWAVTRGARGVIWRDRGRWGEIPALPVRAVDTLGAGDVFHGAFCHAFAESGEFVAALESANRVAARFCASPGSRSHMHG